MMQTTQLQLWFLSRCALDMSRLLGCNAVTDLIDCLDAIYAIRLGPVMDGCDMPDAKCMFMPLRIARHAINCFY